MAPFSPFSIPLRHASENLAAPKFNLLDSIAMTPSHLFPR